MKRELPSRRAKFLIAARNRACLDYLREGHTRLVTKLDWLARSASDFHGVAFKALDDADADTTTRSGKLLVGLFNQRASLGNLILTWTGS